MVGFAGQVYGVALNTRWYQVDAAVQSILDQVGRIDLLINNAGYTQAGALEENCIAEIQAQFDTNLF